MTPSAESTSLVPEARAAEPIRGSGERRARSQDGTPRERAYVVRVVRPDGKLEERRVTVGVMNRINAQVLSGLSEGEQVVIGSAEPQAKAASGANTKGGGAGGAMRGRL